MGLVYNKKLGGRQYHNWTAAQLQLAVEDIKCMKWLIQQASEKWAYLTTTHLNTVFGNSIWLKP